MQTIIAQIKYTIDAGAQFIFLAMNLLLQCCTFQNPLLKLVPDKGFATKVL